MLPTPAKKFQPLNQGFLPTPSLMTQAARCKVIEPETKIPNYEVDLGIQHLAAKISYCFRSVKESIISHDKRLVAFIENEFYLVDP